LRLYYQHREIDNSLSELDKKINTVEKSNESLRNYLGSLDNPSFLEKEAREKFNLKFIDESVAFIYNDKNLITSGSGENASSGSFRKWLKYIFN